MGRRRKRDDDWIGVVAQLAGVVMLLSLISPQVHQTISAVGFIAACVLGVAVVCLIGFGVYRFATRAQRARVVECNVDSAILPPSATTQETRPQTTADLIEQLRSIDWFQFEKLIALAYRKLGYTVTRRGGANPDAGIDLVLEKNGDRWAVQCKQWKTWNIGVKAMRRPNEDWTEIWLAGEQLSLLLEVCLLHEIGFSEQAITTLLPRNRRTRAIQLNKK